MNEEQRQDALDDIHHDRFLAKLIEQHADELSEIAHPLAERVVAHDLTGVEVNQQWLTGCTVLSRDNAALVFSENDFEFVNPQSLDQLLEACRSEALPLHDDLPIFGTGEDPSNTCGVWSWDDTRMMVGDCSDDLEIVERGEL